MIPGGVAEWPCSIRTNVTRRLLLAASIMESSIMKKTPSRVPRDGGLRVRTSKKREPLPFYELQPGRLVLRIVGVVRGKAAAAHVAAIVG